MTTLSDAFSRPEEFDHLAREIAAQLSRPGDEADGRAVWTITPRQSASDRPELTTVLTSVSRAADLLAGMRSDLLDAQERARLSEERVAALEAELSANEHRMDAAMLERDAECAGLRERLFAAQSRAQQAEESLQHLLRVVLDKLKT